MCIYKFVNVRKNACQSLRAFRTKMSAKVSTLENELQFKIDLRRACHEFFWTVSRNLGVHETWFFGILYKDADDEDIWIDASKKPLKAVRNHIEKLKYRVKYYPEDVEEELLEDITVRYFYLQVKALILQDAIYCPPQTCVLLASYALQANYGDYSSEEFQNGFLAKLRFLPERVYNQHKMDSETWEASILNLWKKHVGMLKEEAMMEYLKLAQNLEMYGVTYFNIRNKKGTEILLGVTALGLNIYKLEDKLNPTISFPWSEIRNLNFRDRKFTIRSTDKNSANFVFYSQDGKINKRILNLGVGNHSLYIRRRKADSLEVLQMKAKAAETRKTRLLQCSKLRSEVEARESAEQRERDYQNLISQLKDEMNRRQESLMEARETIEKLRQQLEELRNAKQHLEEQQKELRNMMLTLEMNKNMEAAEREQLRREINDKQSIVEKIRVEVQQKDLETRNLQEQIDAAREREEQLRREREKREVEQSSNGKLVQSEVDASSLHNNLPDLVVVKEDLREELKMLQEQLDKSRDASKETQLDKIHRENVRDGKDKYKTLAEIRKGNTLRRIDLFENL